MTQNIPTKTHYDPNLLNCFTMTQNKVLKLFIFLNFVPRRHFFEKLGPKLERTLFKMKPHTKRYSRVLILNSTVVFLNLLPIGVNLLPKIQNLCPK